jgi:hypothetical protein
MSEPIPSGYIPVTFVGHEFNVPQVFYEYLVTCGLAPILVTRSFLITGFKEPEPEETNGQHYHE